jgi:hypothetical protein
MIEEVSRSIYPSIAKLIFSGEQTARRDKVHVESRYRESEGCKG